jgi:DNA-binding CsgD family transcriptional regulator
VLVDERGVIRAATADGEGWIALLRAAEGPAAAVFPSPVTVMCAAAQLRYRPEEGATVRGRFRLPAGPWLAVHASPTRGAAVSPGLVAVTVELAGARDVAPLIFHANGLTPRQRQLAGLLLDGLSTKEIARTLAITPYTVQDHVKAVLGKLGVRSRQELAACVLGRRL